MSHFSVLVIGLEVEKQLAPYHEFECTDFNDEYVQDVDVTEELLLQIADGGTEAINEALENYGLEDKIIESEDQVDTEGDHKYGYAVVKDGVLIKAINRTNPNAQWDWWKIGGRWSGFLKTATGVVDQALKSNVDFDGMRREAGETAAIGWDKASKAADGRSWESWERVREKHGNKIEEARAEYNNQEAMVAVRTELKAFFGVDEFLTPREQYIEAARDTAISPYAIVINGEWVSKGKMGWFGMSDNTIEQDEWNKKVSELLLSLPEDTLLTIVDCHI